MRRMSIVVEVEVEPNGKCRFIVTGPRGRARGGRATFDQITTLADYVASSVEDFVVTWADGSNATD